MPTLFFSFQAGLTPTILPTVDEHVIITAPLRTMRAEQHSSGRYSIFVEGNTFAYRVTAETYIDFLNALDANHKNFRHIRGPLSL
jgi:hypothetical protein